MIPKTGCPTSSAPLSSEDEEDGGEQTARLVARGMALSRGAARRKTKPNMLPERCPRPPLSRSLLRFAALGRPDFAGCCWRWRWFGLICEEERMW